MAPSQDFRSQIAVTFGVDLPPPGGL